jgi:hypothetical protein
MLKFIVGRSACSYNYRHMSVRVHRGYKPLSQHLPTFSGSNELYCPPLFLKGIFSSIRSAPSGGNGWTSSCHVRLFPTSAFPIPTSKSSVFCQLFIINTPEIPPPTSPGFAPQSYDLQSYSKYCKYAAAIGNHCTGRFQRRGYFV